LFGSGDGGWTKVEERICNTFAKQGYLVAGIDSKLYADQAYDWKTLASDFLTIQKSLENRLSIKSNSVTYGGFSTGAEQAVAAAAYTNIRPANLKSLILLAPGKRGRFGLTMSDLMGLTPTGSGSFSLTDYAENMSGLKIVQFHGEHDTLDSTDWLKKLTVPHKLIIVPGGWHTYHGADDAFLARLIESLNWLNNLGKPLAKN
jgi:phosphatidylglycerol lysyltransferase